MHFSKVNDNKKRIVNFINEIQPKVAGSTLKIAERRALVREESKKKREVLECDSRNTATSSEDLSPPNLRFSLLVRESTP